MKTSNMEERLALVGALVALLGVSLAAEDALAADHAEITATAVAIHEAAEGTLATAEQANAEAAAHAVESLAIENWIDLDIQLEDRTSTLIARSK